MFGVKSITRLVELHPDFYQPNGGNIVVKTCKTNPMHGRRRVQERDFKHKTVLLLGNAKYCENSVRWK